MDFNRFQTPQPGTPRPFHFPEFERFHLNNGLEILLVERREFPLISINLCIKSSAVADPKQKEGTANLLCELLSEGTNKRTSTQIAEELEFTASQFSAYTSWNAIYLDMNTLSRHIDSALDIFSDILQNSLFPENELHRIRQEILTDRMRIVDNPAKLNAEQFVRFLYPHMRYSLPIEGSETSIKQIQRTDIQDLYKKHIVPENAVLIFAGDINRETAETVSERYFSSWGKSHLPESPDLTFQQPPKAHVHLIHKPGASQTELRMGHLGIERSNPDYYAVTLLNEVLGGYFLSRINKNLREEHGYTYGAGSAFNYRPGLGPFHISSAVQSEYTAQAVQEILNEVSKIRSEKISTEELKNARGQITGLFPIAFETADQIAFGISNIVLSRLPDDYYNTYRENISAVTREAILGSAQKYLHPEKMQIVVTGDREIIEKDLRASFDVTVYNVQGKKI